MSEDKKTSRLRRLWRKDDSKATSSQEYARSKFDTAKATASKPSSVAVQQSSGRAEIGPSFASAGPSGAENRSDRTINYSSDKTLLWDEAYEALKADDPELIKAYEKFLTDPDEGLTPDASLRDGKTRREEMDALLQRSLDKTAKLDRVEGRLLPALDIVLSVKHIIGTALSSVPIAAVAWTPICITLQMFSKIFTEGQENRNGIVEIVKKMKWYSSLSLLLLKDNFKEAESYRELLPQIAGRIRDLYVSLLRYIIETICTHHHNPAFRTLNRTFSDWKGKMEAVTRAENDVKTYAEQHRGQMTNTYLHRMLNAQLEDKQSKIISKLCVRNMDDEMEGLESRKDQLLAGSYEWIMRHDKYKEFLEWREDHPCQVLWVKGEAGVGKTMLMIGVIRELKGHFTLPSLSYFFCQGTDDKFNTATAILKGLMGTLLYRERSLIRHLEDEVSRSGDQFLSDDLAFPTLARIFKDMILDNALDRAVFVVDALDECEESKQAARQSGLESLLRLIQETVKMTNKIKWLVSARPTTTISFALNDRIPASGNNGPDLTPTGKFASIEVNSKSVAQALEVYIDQKVSDLGARYLHRPEKNAPPSRLERFEKQESILKDVAEKVRQKTDGTFLWVALVFQELNRCEPSQMVDRLNEIPRELEKLYTRAIQRIRNVESYKAVFAVVVVAQRPLLVPELLMLANAPEIRDEINYIENTCLLTVRDDTVYFVHQSAKDHLTRSSDSIIRAVWPRGFDPGHFQIVRESLIAMSSDLTDDNRKLEDPNIPVSKLELSCSNRLRAVRYSCVYWIDHFCKIATEDDDVDLNSEADLFFREHLLQWLEALSIIRSIPHGLKAIGDLQELLRNARPQSTLLDLLTDADRFVRLSKDGIEAFPLQIYSSALLFSPARSTIRALYRSQLPEYLSTDPTTDQDWDPCLQTFSGYGVHFAFAPSGESLATTSPFRLSTEATVYIIDLKTGSYSQCISASNQVNAIAYSRDGQWLAWGTCEGQLEIRDATSHASVRKSLPVLSEKWFESLIRDIDFSPANQWVAVHTGDISIWDIQEGSLIWRFQPETRARRWFIRGPLKFSPDGKYLAEHSPALQIWDVESRDRIHNSFCSTESFDWAPGGRGIAVARTSVELLDLNFSLVKTIRGIWPPKASQYDCITFSSDGRFLAFSEACPVYSDYSIQIWSMASWNCVQTFRTSQKTYSLAFSSDGRKLASGTTDGSLQLWDICACDGAYNPSDPLFPIDEVIISPKGDWFMTKEQATIKIWDMNGICQHTLAEGIDDRAPIVISPLNESFAGLTEVVGRSNNGIVKLWDRRSGSCLQTFQSEGLGIEPLETASDVTSIAISPCGDLLADGTKALVRVWNITSGAKTHTFGSKAPISMDRVVPRAVAFSSDSQSLVVAVFPGGIKMWNLSNNTCQWSISLPEIVTRTLWNWIVSLVLSRDSERLVLSTQVGHIILWDLKENICLQAFRLQDYERRWRLGSTAFKDRLINTERGMVLLPTDSGISSNSLDEATEENFVQFQGPGLSGDDAWITWNGHNVLWLPPVYRPRCSAVNGHTLLVGCHSGQVLRFAFKSDFKPFSSEVKLVRKVPIPKPANLY